MSDGGFAQLWRSALQSSERPQIADDSDSDDGVERKHAERSGKCGRRKLERGHFAGLHRRSAGAIVDHNSNTTPPTEGPLREANQEEVVSAESMRDAYWEGGVLVTHLLTLSETARVLRLNTKTVRERLLGTGALKGFKVEGRWRVDEEDLVDYIETQRATNSSDRVSREELLDRIRSVTNGGDSE